MIEKKLFIPSVYTDEETKKLSKLYDLKTCPSAPVCSSLGQYEEEIGAQKLLAFSNLFGEIVGVAAQDLFKFNEDSGFRYIDYLDNKYVRRKTFNEVDILFPTEQLLISQGVKEWE